MELMPRFVNVNDIENFLGINLIDKFKDEQKANVFIRMTEEQVMMWLNANTFRNINFSKLTDFEKENFEKAIIHQVYYINAKVVDTAIINDDRFKKMAQENNCQKIVFLERDGIIKQAYPYKKIDKTITIA